MSEATEFYSRTGKNIDEPELLKDHLVEVSTLTGVFADKFCEKDVGRLIGVLHDAGKASQLFQGVLKGTEHKVNHECAGAFLIPKKLPLLAIVIYAHHKGLLWNCKDDLNASYDGSRETESRETNRRFSVKGKEEYNAVCKYIKNIINELPEITPKPINECSSLYYKNIPAMLHARMLLSCLCDADYTSASAFSNNKVSEATEEVTLHSKELLDALVSYKNGISQTSFADSNVNKIRNDIFNYCVKAGEEKEGFFTLTAPTGTGKTFSLFAFALSHALHNEKRRIIIVLPYLSIISQNARIYREICSRAGFDCVLEAHSMAKYTEQTELYAERWNSPVIITTSVKFFESLFASKPTDMRFLHEIADSVVVFDEAQSIPTELIGSTMESVDVLIKMFRCSVLFSTATQPYFEKRKDLKDIFQNTHEIIPNPEIIYKMLSRVEINWKISNNERTSFEEIAREMALEKSAACVVNLKSHAHKLYNLLSEFCSEDSIFFISTDMCKLHREKVINIISERQKNNLSCLLVSTSCIEAGVDFDFDVMYRSLAPLDSIVQCAGRCNRNGRNYGKMTVFIPDEEKLYPSVYFERASAIVLVINSRHNIDINNTEHIKEYYNELFLNNPKDKVKLTEAINNYDFAESEKQYKFINQTGMNILVPYSNEMDLFDKLKSQASGDKAITKEWIKNAASITVNTFKSEWLESHCFGFHPNMIRKDGKLEQSENWYILEERSIYDDKTGLTINEDKESDYTL